MPYLKLDPQYLRKIQGIYDQLCCQRDSIQTSSQAQQELLSQIVDSLDSIPSAVLNLVLTELPIVDSNGDAVASNLVAGEIEIPLLPAAPGVVNVNQSDGSLIAAVNVASGATVPYDVANSEITIATHTFSVLATGSLNVPIVDTGGNTVATTLVGGEVVVDDLPCVQTKTLELIIPYSEADTSVSITIVTDSGGTITTADTTGLTTVTYTVNGTAETLPITLVSTDVLVLSFDAATSDGIIKLTGTYV